MLRDNFDFYDQHEREQAAWEAKLPTCDGCGDHMSEWYEFSYGLQTWRFCPSCTDHRYFEED